MLLLISQITSSLFWW